MERNPNMQLVHIRIPKGLHRKLMRDAHRAGLTLNGEVLRRLEAYEDKGVSYQTEHMFNILSDEIRALKARLEQVLHETPVTVSNIAERKP